MMAATIIVTKLLAYQQVNHEFLDVKSSNIVSLIVTLRTTHYPMMMTTTATATATTTTTTSTTSKRRRTILIKRNTTRNMILATGMNTRYTNPRQLHHHPHIYICSSCCLLRRLFLFVLLFVPTYQLTSIGNGAAAFCTVLTGTSTRRERQHHQSTCSWSTKQQLEYHYQQRHQYPNNPSQWLPFGTTFGRYSADGRDHLPVLLASRTEASEQDTNEDDASFPSSNNIGDTTNETPTNSRVVRQNISSSSLSPQQPRAGMDGYSLIRQPLYADGQWDPDVIPNFDLPTGTRMININQQSSITMPLDDEDESKGSTNMEDRQGPQPSSLLLSSQQQLDSTWWSSGRTRKNGVGVQQQQQPPKSRQQDIVQSSSVSLTSSSTTITTTAMPEQLTKSEFNLIQRTLTALDYFKILDALKQHCLTIPAIQIIDAAITNLLVTPKMSTHEQQQHHNHGSNRQSRNESCPIMELGLHAQSPEECKAHYQAVKEMDYILQGGVGIGSGISSSFYRTRRGTTKEPLMGRPPPALVASTFDLGSLLQKADQGQVLEGEEIREISNMMNAMEGLVLWGKSLRTYSSEAEQQTQLDVESDRNDKMTKRENIIGFIELPKLVEGIQINGTLQDLLYNALDETGRLSGTAFPTVGQLRSKIKSLRTNIMAQLDSLVKLPSVQPKLALESGGPLFSQVGGSGRLVIPIQTRYATSLGIVHDTSRSGKTAYVEPSEIVGPTNELKQAEGELRNEEARVWCSLTEQVILNSAWLERSVHAVGLIDLVLARIQLGTEWGGGVIPTVQDVGVISLRNVKHPILLLRKIASVVGSDILNFGVGQNQGLVLTGPNSGGKTVILKLLGLVALMTRAGIPLPADQPDTDSQIRDLYHPRVDFFDPVLADIGDIQSVGDDLSTFSGHMLACREILSHAGPRTLVLMDELGSGTDPSQGVAIAQSILETLLEAGTRVAITTHYTQLKQLAASDPRFDVAGMQFVRGRPTYKLLPGTVGESFALAVAERWQIPTPVIDRARELMNSETLQMGDLIRKLEDQKVQLEEQAEELELKRMEITQLELSLKEELIQLEKKQLSARREEAKKFAAKLEEKEQMLEGILEKLKSDPSRRVVAKSWDDIKFLKRDTLNEAENIPSVLARKLQAASASREAVEMELIPIAEMRDKPVLKVGDVVRVCRPGPMYGKQATVMKALGGRVEVQVNSMMVAFKLTEIALPISSSNAAVISEDQSLRKTRPSSSLSSLSKSTAKALATERLSRSSISSDWEMNQDSTTTNTATKTTTTTTTTTTTNSASGGISMRMESNTVDIRGCTMTEAETRIRDKMSTSLMAGRSVIYILHGHGSSGTLKTKIRQWLKTEQRQQQQQQQRQLIKNWQPADPSDGGDAFTRVDLR